MPRREPILECGSIPLYEWSVTMDRWLRMARSSSFDPGVRFGLVSSALHPKQGLCMHGHPRMQCARSQHRLAPGVNIRADKCNLGGIAVCGLLRRREWRKTSKAVEIPASLGGKDLVVKLKEH